MGKFVVGTSMGQNLLPLLRQHGGVHKNGKSHKSHRSHKNGKDRKNGKDGEDKYSVYELSFCIMNLFNSERTISYLFVKHLRICSLYVFVKEFSPAGNSDSLVSDGCANSTPYGAHFTRPTHAIFLVCT